MYDYSEHIDQPDQTDVLGQIAALVNNQQELEEEIEALETRLKRKKSQLASVSEHELPMLLDQVGVAELTTSNGAKIKIKETIRVNVSKDRQNAAMDWLVEHGHGGMIKSEVTAKYDRGMEEVAEDCRQQLVDMLGEDHVSCGRKVEPSTLRAFVKRQLEAGEDIPLELFGVYRQRSTEIK